MQYEDEQCEDQLMDSLLCEQARVDREQAIRDIEYAILKNKVSHVIETPAVDWKRLLVSGSVAAALVLGFGFLLSTILSPGTQGGPSANTDNADSGEMTDPLVMEYTIVKLANGQSVKRQKSYRSGLPSGVPMSAPSMVFTSPLTEMGIEIDFNPDWGADAPADLHTKPDETLNKAHYAKLVDQEWSSPYEKPLSSFAVDVEHASYANIRTLVSQGAPIPADVVRIEECVNAFKYNYQGPKDGKPFAVHTDLITCPWNGANLLVKVGIKGRDKRSETEPAAIAKDLKVLVEFNPQLVGSYRLIGYASPALKTDAKEDHKADGGEIEAGHTVTAFYELAPVRKQQTLAKVDPLKYQRVGSSPNTIGPNDEWLTLKLQHKQPLGDDSSIQEQTLKGAPTPWLHANTDTRFATAVVLFGMKLRNMDEVEGITWQQVAQVAEPGLDGEGHKERVEFVRLIETLEAADR